MSVPCGRNKVVFFVFVVKFVAKVSNCSRQPGGFSGRVLEVNAARPTNRVQRR